MKVALTRLRHFGSKGFCVSMAAFLAVVVFHPATAAADQWPRRHFGQFVDVPIENVVPSVVKAETLRNNLTDAQYDVAVQSCDDGSFVSFSAKGKYKNPGFHWLVVVRKDAGTIEVIDGM